MRRLQKQERCLYTASHCYPNWEIWVQTSIGNQAFGICLLNPPYDHDPESKRTEHAFLTHSTRYLNDGGLLVFIVPRQRLAVSAKYLASYYYRLRCWAFPHPEREAFDQVVVMGYRMAEPRLDEEAQGQVLAWAEGEPEPLYSQGYPIYTAITSDAGDSCSPPAPPIPWRRRRRPGAPACGPAPK